MTAQLYGVGVGPGDPELITLKALKILQQVEVVAYQAAAQRQSVARQIVASYLRGDQQELCFRFPRALDPIAAKSAYDQAIAPIAECLEQGKQVAVLCEGDPLFYGSFMYLFTRLSDRYPTEVVPGVCSPMAAAALGLPLSYRNDVFSVLSATLAPELLETHLLSANGAAIIKLARHFDQVREILIKLDLVERAKYIECATMANQKTLPILEVNAANVPYFAMVLIPTQAIY
ncbi:MAG: precorrin-2 C(20)-methyltransferase [Pseudanabaenaceae cyanobacterium bins.68]|nr:precorrin-2 C(20)-methyltransferase [Pseudanabaenaceae cyanobacterium bins.68]